MRTKGSAMGTEKNLMKFETAYKLKLKIIYVASLHCCLELLMPWVLSLSGRIGPVGHHQLLFEFKKFCLPMKH